MANNSNIILSKTLKSLEIEENILKQLLIRNFNQHRTTKLYNCMTRVGDLIKRLFKMNITELSNECDQMLNHLQLSSVSSLTRHRIRKCISCCNNLEKLFRVIFDLDRWLTKGGIVCKSGLQEGLFIPLYTMWMAIMSSLSHTNIGLLMFLLSQYISLLSSLQNISLVDITHWNELTTNNNKILGLLSLSIKNPSFISRVKLMLKSYAIRYPNILTFLEINEYEINEYEHLNQAGTISISDGDNTLSRLSDQQKFNGYDDNDIGDTVNNPDT